MPGRRVAAVAGCGVVFLCLVATASGRWLAGTGYTTGTYSGSTNQVINSQTVSGSPAYGDVHFQVRQGAITGFQFHAAFRKCTANGLPPPPGAALPPLSAFFGKPVVIRADGRFSSTQTGRGFVGGVVVKVTVTGRIVGARVTGTISFPGFTKGPIVCSGARVSFTATPRGGGETLSRAWGEVAATASPPSLRVGQRLTLQVIPAQPDAVAQAGGVTLREWWAASLPGSGGNDPLRLGADNCLGGTAQVFNTALPATGRFRVAHSFTFPKEGLYTLCVEILDASGNRAAGLSLSDKPWPVYPILVCRQGTRKIAYNPLVGILQCDNRRY